MRQKVARWFLVGYKYLSQLQRQIILVSWGFVSECQHSPTCSEYMAEQISQKGWRGVGLGLKRLLSCH